MAKFNLIDESWIKVVSNVDGLTKEVSLRTLFENSQEYLRLGGELESQNFAVLRLLLAVLHTVFSRFDAEGIKYEYLELNEKFVPVNKILEDDFIDYESSLLETWKELWEKGKFPDVISTYLDKWEDRFYLLDEKYPFYQVTTNDLVNFKVEKTDFLKGNFFGKNINRTISESNNKTALFSPRYEFDGNKEILSYSELARWLVMLQGYIEVSDKNKFLTDNKYTTSNGWLYNLGGLYFEGENLFETLLINLVLLHPSEQFRYNIQKPSWEIPVKEKLANSLSNYYVVDNLAELYTNWSRAIIINPEVDMTNVFSLHIIKLIQLNQENQFLEPMTIWKYNKKMDVYFPKEWDQNQAIWRSFQLISGAKLPSIQTPGVVKWLGKIQNIIPVRLIKANSISIKSGANAASRVLEDEIHDSIFFRDRILTDLSDNGWTFLINDEIDIIKQAINFALKNFGDKVHSIRNVRGDSITKRLIQDAYFEIDKPFREWLRSINDIDNRDDKIIEWRSIAKHEILEVARKLLAEGNNRDYIGIELSDGKGYLNLPIAYNEFRRNLNKIFKENGK